MSLILIESTASAIDFIEGGNDPHRTLSCAQPAVPWLHDNVEPEVTMSKAAVRIATAVAVALTLATVSGTAVALRQIEVSVFVDRAVARSFSFISEGGIVTCPVTLTTEFLFTISKARGSRMAWTRLTVGEASCTGGRARPLNTLEGWPVNYVSFTGTLPNITSIRVEVVGFAFLVSAFGGFGECLYRGNAQFTTEGGTPAFSLRADERVALPLSRNLNGLFCAATAAPRGTIQFERALLMRLI
jgi:hypothetical protein